MASMSFPTVELSSNSVLFRLPVECVEVRLEVGNLPRTHPHHPLDCDDLPVPTCNESAAASASNLFRLRKHHDCGNRPGKDVELAVSGHWLHFELIKKRIHTHHLPPSLWIAFHLCGRPSLDPYSAYPSADDTGTGKNRQIFSVRGVFPLNPDIATGNLLSTNFLVIPLNGSNQRSLFLTHKPD